jgi:predicted nucleic acid-binding protein
MILVFDASPLIAFYSEKEINEPSTLHELIKFGYEFVVPIAVVKEIQRGRKLTASRLVGSISMGRITVYNKFSIKEVSRLMARYPKLDEGETQVLILGKRLKRKCKEYFCILDEGPATKLAIQHGIAKKGTIGLLDLLNDLGIINKEKKENLLNVLRHSSFRIKNSHASVNR